VPGGAQPNTALAPGTHSDLVNANHAFVLGSTGVVILPVAIASNLRPSPQLSRPQRNQLQMYRFKISRPEHWEMIGFRRDVAVGAPGRMAEGPVLLRAHRLMTKEVATRLDGTREAITRPDGTRSAFELAARRLFSIVESADDAIVSKDLTGTILSWNVGTGGRSIFLVTPITKSLEVLLRSSSRPTVSTRKKIFWRACGEASASRILKLCAGARTGPLLKFL
jgi:hypothetical protein